MNKTTLLSAILVSLGLNSAHAATTTGNNFTMNDPNNGIIGGTNDVVMTWDGSLYGAAEAAAYTGAGSPSNMSLSSDEVFLGHLWTAHTIQVFGPGTYTFEACLADGSFECTSPTPITMTVGANQIGAHMLFNWNGNVNNDVVNVWDRNALFNNQTPLFEGADNGLVNNSGVLDGALNTSSTIFALSSSDDNGDGINGVPILDGPFKGSNLNFNIVTVPIPAALWLLGSGLVGLVALGRRRNS